MEFQRIGTKDTQSVKRSARRVRPESQRLFLRSGVSGVSVPSRAEMAIASGNANTHDFFEKASVKRYAGASIADSDSADLAEKSNLYIGKKQ